MISIIKYESKCFAANTFIVKDESNVFVVDPTDESVDWICEQCDNINYVFLTHEHYDHISGVNDLCKLYDCCIVCGEFAKDGLSNPKINMSKYIKYLHEYIPFGDKTYLVDNKNYKCYANMYVSDSTEIDWGNHKIFVKSTPGHSKGSISILVDNLYLFSGDVLFKDYDTQLRLPGGNEKQFVYQTMPWIKSLNSDVVVYPGHLDGFMLCEYIDKNI